MKENKEELFKVGDDVLNAIMNAVSKMYILVGSTMGPAGKTVIIPNNEEYGKYKITKDGVSVARVVKSSDEYEQTIINLLREISDNTVKIAGDGTTTSIVLTFSLLKHLLNVRNEDFTIFDNTVNDIIEHIEKTKIKLTNKNIYEVALVSANGDEQIAKMIDKAYSESTVVDVKKSNRETDVLNTFAGIYIPTKPMRSIRNRENYEFELNNTRVIVMDKYVDDNIYKQLLKLNEQSPEPILVVANDCSEKIIQNIEILRANRRANIHIIKSPGFATQRTNLLSDLATYVGVELVVENDSKLSTRHVSKAEMNVIISKTEVQLENKNASIRELIENLESQIKEADDDHTIDLLKQRLDRLKGVSIINVGGKSQKEVEERFDRYEDAVLAVACALEDGIVEGGGLALAKYAVDKLRELGFNPDHKITNPLVFLYLSLLAPFETIKNNGCNIDINDDLISKNIYDPAKVTKTALIQSYNFVKLLLSCNSVILAKKNNNVMMTD